MPDLRFSLNPSVYLAAYLAGCVLIAAPALFPLVPSVHAQEVKSQAAASETVDKRTNIEGTNTETMPDGSGKSSDQPATIEERLGTSEAIAAPREDLAYGAFQRGYYLTAFELALPRAKLGDAKAQTLIAELYDRGLGVAYNPEEATAWYKIASGNGDREAHFGFAVKLLEGRYVEKDREKAKELMRQAADGGHATAAFNYAQLLIDERPTGAGARKALPYFELAASQRVADAYYALAQLYRSGIVEGYPENEKAQEWLLKAARAGVDTAQVELGIWLANGTGGTKDEKAAFAWMSRAANGGNVIARNRLAKMYAQGIGTEPDGAETVKWHILAQRAGLNDAWLDDFINGMDKAMLARGLEAANRFPNG